MDAFRDASENLYDTHKKFLTSFQPEWRFDDNIMSLLIAIAIFTPSRSNIIETEKIKSVSSNIFVHFLTKLPIFRVQQQSYISLLWRYLESIFEEQEKVKQAFTKLMDQLEITRSTANLHIDAYYHVNPAELGQLLVEIFNVKTNFSYQ